MYVLLHLSCTAIFVHYSSEAAKNVKLRLEIGADCCRKIKAAQVNFKMDKVFCMYVYFINYNAA